jgi:hypothetical protein
VAATYGRGTISATQPDESHTSRTGRLSDRIAWLEHSADPRVQRDLQVISQQLARAEGKILRHLSSSPTRRTFTPDDLAA